MQYKGNCLQLVVQALGIYQFSRVEVQVLTVPEIREGGRRSDRDWLRPRMVSGWLCGKNMYSRKELQPVKMLLSGSGV